MTCKIKGLCSFHPHHGGLRKKRPLCHFLQQNPANPDSVVPELKIQQTDYQLNQHDP